MRTTLIMALILLAGCVQEKTYTPQDGDIVFHTSRSAQSQAIQLATGSQYSHMGIVYVTDGEAHVFEAVQPVKATPLNEWIQRGEGGHFVAKRLRNADTLLTKEALKKMHSIGAEMRGKNYDLTFEWSDDRIYCSELVYKIYKRGAGIEVGKLQKLSEFDLSNPIVKAKLVERYGTKIPLDEPVISPGAIFTDTNLMEVTM